MIPCLCSFDRIEKLESMFSGWRIFNHREEVQIIPIFSIIFIFRKCIVEADLSAPCTECIVVSERCSRRLPEIHMQSELHDFESPPFGANAFRARQPPMFCMHDNFNSSAPWDLVNRTSGFPHPCSSWAGMIQVLVFSIAEAEGKETQHGCHFVDILMDP